MPYEVLNPLDNTKIIAGSSGNIPIVLNIIPKPNMKPVSYGADNVIFVPTLNTNSTHSPKIKLPHKIANYHTFAINPVII